MYLTAVTKNLTSLPKHAIPHSGWLLASGNNFQNFETVEMYMENITHLDLSNSLVSGITERAMTSMLKNIKTLDLTNNVLKTLPQSITKFNNTKL